MGLLFWIVVVGFTLFWVSKYRPNLRIFTIAAGIVALVGIVTGWLSGLLGFLALLVFAVVLLIFNMPALRHKLVSTPLLKYVRAVLPPMSETERVAIDAGTVWWEAELFRGAPDWKQLLSYPEARLSTEEQAFVDGPVEELCGMLNDWEITYEHNNLPEPVWQFIKDKLFLGMVIPKKYGGLGFSAMAHSEVVMKLATRSVTGSVSVMVPNSLGPAELLLHYGTEEQKDHYLPRLANGREIPCFALTGPSAGSDAGAMPDYGVVCKGQHNGQEVLGLRVTWEKRYITLGPIATILGLAFRAYDPDHLLGEEEDLGITCALIPTETEGVNIGRRRCVCPNGMDHRWSRHGWARLENVNGIACGWPRNFIAGFWHCIRQSGVALCGRLCACPKTIQFANWKIRRNRRGSGTHCWLHLHYGFRQEAHLLRVGSRRKTICCVRYSQIL